MLKAMNEEEHSNIRPHNVYTTPFLRVLPAESRAQEGLHVQVERMTAMVRQTKNNTKVVAEGQQNMPAHPPRNNSKG